MEVVRYYRLFHASPHSCSACHTGYGLLVLINFSSAETRSPHHPLQRFQDLVREESPAGKFQHLYEGGREVKWIFTTTAWLNSECGCKKEDTQVFVAPKAGTFFLQSDYKNKGTRSDEPCGQLDPCLIVKMRDVRALDEKLEGFAFVGPEYEWPQYLNLLPADCRQSIYDQPYLEGRLGDYLEIRAGRSGKDLECLIGSGIEYNEDQPESVVQHGAILRPGMCIRFYCSDLEQSHDTIRHLHGVITRIDSDCDEVNSVMVRVLLARSNLPPSMDWPSLGRNQVFQTDLFLRVSLDAITGIVRIMPHQLYQHECANGDKLCDLVVVGHLKVHELTGDCQELTGDCLEILKCVSTSKLVFHRVKPLKHAVAFCVLHQTNMLFGCADYGLFGIGNRPHAVYQQYLSNAVTEFALNKCSQANNTRRDNTLHLNMFGPILVSMLHDLLLWNYSDTGSGLKLQDCVTIKHGTVTVIIPTFEAARPLLTNSNGVYDMTQFGYGFVQLYAPIAFKWEMYDTGGGATGASRAVDGFTAITFESYVERDRHNTGLIKGTRATNERLKNANKRQLLLPPSMCPR